jgi:3-oxoacyl-[acyl-carrier protein] reductase
MGPMLDGKSAILTGAGRGIGAAAARLFAAEGARLVINDLDADPLAAVAGEIRAGGGQVATVRGDVADPKTTEALINSAVDNYGGIDILVNNAGFTWDGVVHKMSDEQWGAILDVHLTAAFRLIRAAAPYMREVAKAEMKEHGVARARKIVNVSSTSGTRGNFGQANYAAAKMGLVGLTKTIAKEWGRFNVQVNAAAFGFIETRLTDVKDGTQVVERGGAQIQLGIPEGMREIGVQLIPMERPGTPQEAAGVLLFLASPLSNYVSGHCIEVTGGE